ncbi:hypothetical protein SCLCIDRAFT_157043 [Scleroderma citrinum Foug A]|uniref:Uncharacterized protein n=1 Tax=Scleroderma citrinum Foug A TaxID=1036808 RepID=A0A0C3B043_9AGAM|nr:hypothetical protein SCLCIDRAFT_157043 [Scleroderma citrinum Foug A]
MKAKSYASGPEVSYNRECGARLRVEMKSTCQLRRTLAGSEEVHRSACLDINPFEPGLVWDKCYPRGTWSPRSKSDQILSHPMSAFFT